LLDLAFSDALKQLGVFVLWPVLVGIEVVKIEGLYLMFSVSDGNSMLQMAFAWGIKYRSQDGPRPFFFGQATTITSGRRHDSEHRSQCEYMRIRQEGLLGWRIAGPLRPIFFVVM